MDDDAAATQPWQCPVCLDTLREPMLATCCGHSFCRGCLDAALRRVDACPLCRAPLLSGAYAATPNRALDALLALHGADEGTNNLPSIKTDASGWWRGWTLMTWLRGGWLDGAARRSRQWRHWLRVHAATVQCVFYVWLFGVFVVFLRVQEEEFAEHRRPRLRSGA